MVTGSIGKYQVERHLGGGGMAEVFLARVHGAAGFSRRVAIKRILPGYSDHATFASLFVSEAQLSSQLTHPNIVSVLDFEHDAQHGLFLVMELVEGKDLSNLLETGTLPTSLVIYLVAEVLRGLGYAHNLPAADSEIRGVIHRDVSPHNVLLSWEGAVKVADFGIAKSRAASNASASVVIKGKMSYMSPEQANGEPLDGRSDLFAVGVMLWEMLVGQSLFSRKTLQESLSALFNSTIPLPQTVRPEVSEDVARVAMRLLQRDRSERYATAEDAIRDLLACSDAPRDGRAELVAILEERFAGRTGEAARVAAQAPAPAVWPGGTPAALLPTIVPLPASSVPAPTLGASGAKAALLPTIIPLPATAAAPEPAATAPKARFGPSIALAFAAAVLLAGAVTGAIATLAGGRAPSTPAAAVSAPILPAAPAARPPALPSSIAAPPAASTAASPTPARASGKPKPAAAVQANRAAPTKAKRGQPRRSGMVEVRLDDSAP
jgi:hypothetical protein